MYDLYAAKIQSEQLRMANNQPFNIILRGQMSPTYSAMTLYVSTTTGYPRTLNAIFLITEEAIPISSSNGQTILNAVVRGYLGTQSVTLTSPGATQVNASIDAIPYYNANKLHPVVILQDSSTKEIFAGVTALSLPTSISSLWQLYN